jgi:hypothetical protein
LIRFIHSSSSFIHFNFKKKNLAKVNTGEKGKRDKEEREGSRRRKKKMMMRSAAAVEKNAYSPYKSVEQQQHYSFIGRRIRLKLVISVSWLLFMAVSAHGASACK